MNLKPEELVKVLLYCGNGGDCDACCHPCHGEHGEFEWRCLGPLLLRAATQIEHDRQEIAELKAKVEQYRALIPSWVVCPMCDEDVCIGRFSCPQIDAWIRREKEKEETGGEKDT